MVAWAGHPDERRAAAAKHLAASDLGEPGANTSTSESAESADLDEGRCRIDPSRLDEIGRAYDDDPAGFIGEGGVRVELSTGARVGGGN